MLYRGNDMVGWLVGRPCGYHMCMYIYIHSRMIFPIYMWLVMGLYIWVIYGSNMFYIMEMDLLHPQWYTHPQFLPIGHEYMLAMWCWFICRHLKIQNTKRMSNVYVLYCMAWYWYCYVYSCIFVLYVCACLHACLYIYMCICIYI